MEIVAADAVGDCGRPDEGLGIVVAHYGTKVEDLGIAPVRGYMMAEGSGTALAHCDMKVEDLGIVAGHCDTNQAEDLGTVVHCVVQVEDSALVHYDIKAQGLDIVVEHCNKMVEDWGIVVAAHFAMAD